MASESLVSLDDGLGEVRDLQRANPPVRQGVPTAVSVGRAIGRASVVILSSHLEGYIDSINIEAASAVNRAGLQSDRLPELFRLLHSKHPLEMISGTSWEGSPRAKLLTEFLTTDGWLWEPTASGALDPDRLLTWMSSPEPKMLLRYFRYWGIDDIFSRITRVPHTRAELWKGLKDLVDKRNAIAHGDLATAATPAEVRSYARSVKRFATRADGVLAAHISTLCSSARPW